MKYRRVGRKRLHHPIVGDLDLSFEALELAADPGLRFNIYTAKPKTPSEDAWKSRLTDAVANIDAVVFTQGSSYGDASAAEAVDYGAVKNVLRALAGQRVRIALMTAIGVTRRGSTGGRTAGLGQVIRHDVPSEGGVLFAHGRRGQGLQCNGVLQLGFS